MDLRNCSKKCYEKYKFSSENEAFEVIQMIAKTEFGQWLLLTTEIIDELIASIKTHRQEDDVICKQIKELPLWVVVKPNGTNKKLFYSIIADKRSFASDESETLFRRFEDAGDYLMTDFASADQQRLTHYMDLFGVFCQHVANWCSSFRISARSLMINPKNFKQVIHHIAFTFLVHLEAKSQTSTELNLVRYAYMEVTRHVVQVNWTKIVKKFTTRPKSRLLIYFKKQFQRAFKMMELETPYMLRSEEKELKKVTRSTKEEDEINDSSDNEGEDGNNVNLAKQWKNLVSFVDLSEIHRTQTMLELMYTGVFHNKEERDKMQGYYSIFSKILEQSLLMRNVRQDNMGKASPDHDELLTHEFNYNILNKASQSLRQYLEIQTGNWEECFLKDWNRTLLSFDTTYFATLKASAINFDTSRYTAEKKEKSRKKALENVLDLLKEGKIGVNPFTTISELLNEVCPEGIKANLFEKPQLNGVREIYVLTMMSRIIIAFLESISRTINERIPWEMLTKGTQKSSRARSHLEKIGKLKRSVRLPYEYTAHNSNDASTWCQRFVMTQFAIMLQHLLPEKIWLTCCRILNAVTEKKLELPVELLQKFIENVKVFNYKPEMIELKKQFLGLSANHDLIETPGIGLLTSRCDFMQGILHETSSLYHCMILYFTEAVITSYFREEKRRRKLNERSDIVLTSMASSDDSWMGVSIVSDGQDRESCLHIVAVASHVKKNMYTLFNVEDGSKKSTTASFAPFFEFNSTWYGEEELLPMGKFYYMSLQIMPTDRLESVFNAYAQNRSILLENGAPFFAISVIQELQFWSHYRNMGCSYVPLTFRSYAYQLIQTPLPMLGFFLFEPELMSGIGGQSFALYLHLKQNQLARSVYTQMYKLGRCRLNEDSNVPFLTTRFLLSAGTNYPKFLESVNPPETWRDALYKNPLIAFIKPQTKDDVFFYIYKLATDPNVKLTLMHSNNMNNRVCGVFRVWKPITEVTELRSEEVNQERDHEIDMIMKGIKVDENFERIRPNKIEKTSLLSAFKYFMFEDVVDMTANEERLIFPACDTFNIMIDVLNSFSGCIERVKEREPYQKISNIIIPRRSNVTEMNFRDTFLRKVFKYQTKGSESSYKVSKKYWEEFYPWFRVESEKVSVNDQLSEMLSKSPFIDFLSLLNFVKSTEEKDRTVRILAPIGKRPGLESIFEELVSSNYQRHTKLIRTKNNPHYKGMKPDEFRLITTRLLITLTSPETRKVEAIKKILKSTVRIEDFQMENMKLKMMNDAEFALLAMIAYAQGKSFGFILNMLYKNKHGVVTQWSNPQKKAKDGSYFGLGELAIAIEGVKFLLFVTDDKVDLIKMRTEKGKIPTISGMLVNKLCSTISELGFKNRESYTRGRNTMGFLSISGHRAYNLQEQRLNNDTSRIPIDGSDTLEFPEFEGSIKTLDLEVRGKTIRLVQYLNAGKGTVKAPFCTYTPKEKYFSPKIAKEEPDVMLSKPWLDCWRRFLSLSEEDSMTAVMYASRQSDNDEFKNFVVESLMARAANLTYRSTNNLFFIEAAKVIDFDAPSKTVYDRMADLELDLEVYDMSRDEDTAKRAKELFEMQTKVDQIDFSGNTKLPEGMEFLSDATFNILEYSSALLADHPYWDNFLKLMERAESHDTIGNIIFSPYACHYSGAVELARLFKVDSRPRFNDALSSVREKAQKNLNMEEALSELSSVNQDEGKEESIEKRSDIDFFNDDNDEIRKKEELLKKSKKTSDQKKDKFSMQTSLSIKNKMEASQKERKINSTLITTGDNSQQRRHDENQQTESLNQIDRELKEALIDTETEDFSDYEVNFEQPSESDEEKDGKKEIRHDEQETDS